MIDRRICRFGNKIRSQVISLEKISIIIPTLNEAKTITDAIASTQHGTNVEVIVVDGGSHDSTVELAQSMCVKVLSASSGRACQMNAGASSATGNILLFLHADTRLPAQFDTLVRTTLTQADVIAGAFALRIDASWSLRLIEFGVNWRSRFFQMPYGDQAIFLYSTVFEQMGSFPNLPMMEDFELIRRLRRLGRIAIIPSPVFTSGRRWQQLGVCQTTLMNWVAIISYLLGVSPAKIKHWYRRDYCLGRKNTR